MIRRVPIAARYLGDNDFRPGPFNLGIFSAPIAFLAVVWMAFMGVVFLFPTTPQPGTPDMNYTVVVLFGTLFLSLVWYYFPKYGGVHWFTGPVPTVAEDADSDASSDGSGKKGTVNVSTTEVGEDNA